MSVWAALAWGFGLAYGFAMAAAAYLLKEAVGEPLYEAYLEWWERRLPPDPIEARLAAAQENMRAETFVISDLHIDTWDKVPLIAGKTREQHFTDFLDTIVKSALELYINGDIVDMPPNPREKWTAPDGQVLLQSLLPKYAPIFAKLADFNAGAQPTMTMYMAGNHDMAGSGVRWLLFHLYYLLPGVKLPFQSVWYGNFVISLPYTEAPAKAKTRFFMEHGHYHDPALVLYLLQFVVGLVSSNLQAAMDSLAVGGQRRHSPQAPPPPPGIVVRPLAARGESLWHRLVKWRWRWKARRQLGRMDRQFLRAGEEPLDGILMGHTHLPDFYVYRQGGVRGKLYANTGDWSGYTGHASYAVITEDGLVYLYDWHTNRAPHHS